jgi:hypothetical protein
VAFILGGSYQPEEPNMSESAVHQAYTARQDMSA